MHKIKHTPILSHNHPSLGYRELDRSVRFEIDGRQFVIPEDFVWDGASIPKLFWFRFGHPFDDIHEAASLFHDAAYDGKFGATTRKEADDLYRLIIIAKGQNRFRAFLEWSAIRLFGKKHWATRVIITVASLTLACSLTGCKILDAIPSEWKVAGITYSLDWVKGIFQND